MIIFSTFQKIESSEKQKCFSDFFFSSVSAASKITKLLAGKNIFLVQKHLSKIMYLEKCLQGRSDLMSHKMDLGRKKFSSMSLSYNYTVSFFSLCFEKKRIFVANERPFCSFLNIKPLFFYRKKVLQNYKKKPFYCLFSSMWKYLWVGRFFCALF